MPRKFSPLARRVYLRLKNVDPEKSHLSRVVMGGNGKCDFCKEALAKGEDAIRFSIFEGSSHVSRSYHLDCVQLLCSRCRTGRRRR